MGEDRVMVSWTGNGEAELHKTVPITPKPSQERRVIMSFGPGGDADDSLPALKPGDRLEVGVELEVTSDASDVGRVGEPYDFAPAIEVQLLLANDPKVTVAKRGEAVGGPSKRVKLSHDLHHAVVVFDGVADKASFEIPAAGVGWNGPIHLNVVISASHPEAKKGQLLLIGQNEPDGSVLGDMSAVSVVRWRPAEDRLPEPKRLTEKRLRNDRLPLQGDVKRVLYSLPLKDLAADEQLRVRAEIDASAKHLGYRGRIKTRVFLADSPDQLEPEPGTTANEIASSKGQISKGNGFNCLPKEEKSRTTKVGVLRIVKPTKKQLFVNVVAVAGDPDKKLRPDHLELHGSGGLSVTRFPPEMRG